MGRSIRIPGLIDLIQADARSDIRGLANDARLDRKFDLRGPLINRILVMRIRNVLRIAGMPLPSVAPRDDAERRRAQDNLRQRLDPAGGNVLWDEETIAGLVAAVRAVPGAPALGPATQQAVGRLFAADYKASAESWAAAGVLDAAGGAEPGDLGRLVADLGKTAAALTETDGELEAVVEDLGTVAGTLGDLAPELEQSIVDMPATLQAARQGLTALEGTLARLQATAPGARPSVQRLTEVLRKLPPVLSRARPLLADLRPLAADLGPAFADLAPTAGLLRELLSDLVEPEADPVLGRLRDSIVPAVLASSTHDLPPRTTRLYEELAYFVTGFDGAASYLNAEGSQLNFNVGNNQDSISLPTFPGVAPRAAAGHPGRGMR
jgi:hypothetical protein